MPSPPPMRTSSFKKVNFSILYRGKNGDKGSHITEAASILSVAMVLSVWLVAGSGRFEILDKRGTTLLDTRTGTHYYYEGPMWVPSLCGPAGWFCDCSPPYANCSEQP